MFFWGKRAENSHSAINESREKPPPTSVSIRSLPKIFFLGICHLSVCHKLQLPALSSQTPHALLSLPHLCLGAHPARKLFLLIPHPPQVLRG